MRERVLYQLQAERRRERGNGKNDVGLNSKRLMWMQREATKEKRSLQVSEVETWELHKLLSCPSLRYGMMSPKTNALKSGITASNLIIKQSSQRAELPVQRVQEGAVRSNKTKESNQPQGSGRGRQQQHQGEKRARWKETKNLDVDQALEKGQADCEKKLRTSETPTQEEAKGKGKHLSALNTNVSSRQQTADNPGLKQKARELREREYIERQKTSATNNGLMT
eukprot:gene11200-21347_t